MPLRLVVKMAADMFRIFIGGRINNHVIQTKALTGIGDSDGNFTPVCD